MVTKNDKFFLFKRLSPLLVLKKSNFWTFFKSLTFPKVSSPFVHFFKPLTFFSFFAQKLCLNLLSLDANTQHHLEPQKLINKQTNTNQAGAYQTLAQRTDQRSAEQTKLLSTDYGCALESKLRRRHEKFMSFFD